MLKMAFVRAIAKRLIGRHAAAAYGNDSSALEAVFISLHINYFKIAVYFN